MAKELYVGNVPYSTTEQDLLAHFRDYNPESATIINDRETGRSRGFGFVKFADPADADKAAEALHDQDFGGRPAIVRPARPKR